MIDRTDAATQQLNFELNNNDLRLQMAEIMKSIDGYDAVDSEEFEKVREVRTSSWHPLTPRRCRRSFSCSLIDEPLLI